MTRAMFCVLSAGLLSGCASMMPLQREPAAAAPVNAVPDPELSLGGGYRTPDDPCVRTGSTPLTAPFVNAETDLVACPIDFAGRPAFQINTGGREVTRTDDWVVYRVPLVGPTAVPDVLFEDRG